MTNASLTKGLLAGRVELISHSPLVGTNYYVRPHPLWVFEEEENQQLHVGKSPGGWCFLLRVYPEKNINNLSDWVLILRKKDAEIFDEYGSSVTYQQMLDIITRRSNPVPTKRYSIEQWAERGPNNLLRYAENNSFGISIKHGPGTWDCVTGEFS